MSIDDRWTAQETEVGVVCSLARDGWRTALMLARLHADREVERIALNALDLAELYSRSLAPESEQRQGPARDE